MQDMEIQNGAKLTVRESQMAAFVNEGRMADVLGPGLYTLNTNTLPLLTNLMNWDKMFQSPFKSDVYFFSSRLQTNQRWGTAQPVTVRDKDFGAVRLRAFGIYSWRLTDPRTFHTKVSGTKELYRVEDLEGQLRNTIVGRMSDTFAESQVPFLDMAANQIELGQRIAEHLRPSFAELGLTLDSFVVENLSLPEELQKRLDQRIGMNMIGDMGKYTQFQVAESLPIAAANEGGGLAGAGVGIGRGLHHGAADDERDASRSIGRSGAANTRASGGSSSSRTIGARGLAGCAGGRRNSVSNAASRSRSGPSSVPNAERSSSCWASTGRLRVGGRSAWLRRRARSAMLRDCSSVFSRIIAEVDLASGLGTGMAQVSGSGWRHRTCAAFRIAPGMPHVSGVWVGLPESVLLPAAAGVGI